MKLIDELLMKYRLTEEALLFIVNSEGGPAWPSFLRIQNATIDQKSIDRVGGMEPNPPRLVSLVERFHLG